MTNSQAATHESWLVRCSPHAPGFSRSNQHEFSIKNKFDFRIVFDFEKKFDIGIEFDVEIEFVIGIEFDIEKELNIQKEFDVEIKFNVEIKFDFEIEFLIGIEFDIEKDFNMKKGFDIEKEFDIRIEVDVKKELFDFENEFDIENEPITNLLEMNGPNGLPYKTPYIDIYIDLLPINFKILSVLLHYAYHQISVLKSMVVKHIVISNIISVLSDILRIGTPPDINKIYSSSSYFISI